MKNTRKKYFYSFLVWVGFGFYPFFNLYDGETVIGKAMLWKVYTTPEVGWTIILFHFIFAIIVGTLIAKLYSKWEDTS